MAFVSGQNLANPNARTLRPDYSKQTVSGGLNRPAVGGEVYPGKPSTEVTKPIDQVKQEPTSSQVTVPTQTPADKFGIPKEFQKFTPIPTTTQTQPLPQSQLDTETYNQNILRKQLEEGTSQPFSGTTLSPQQIAKAELLRGSTPIVNPTGVGVDKLGQPISSPTSPYGTYVISQRPEEFRKETPTFQKLPEVSKPYEQIKAPKTAYAGETYESGKLSYIPNEILGAGGTAHDYSKAPEDILTGTNQLLKATITEPVFKVGAKFGVTEESIGRTFGAVSENLFKTKAPFLYQTQFGRQTGSNINQFTEGATTYVLRDIREQPLKQVGIFASGYAFGSAVKGLDLGMKVLTGTTLFFAKSGKIAGELTLAGLVASDVGARSVQAYSDKGSYGLGEVAGETAKDFALFGYGMKLAKSKENNIITLRIKETIERTPKVLKESLRFPEVKAGKPRPDIDYGYLGKKPKVLSDIGFMVEKLKIESELKKPILINEKPKGISREEFLDRFRKSLIEDRLKRASRTGTTVEVILREPKIIPEPRPDVISIIDKPIETRPIRNAVQTLPFERTETFKKLPDIRQEALKRFYKTPEKVYKSDYGDLRGFRKVFGNENEKLLLIESARPIKLPKQRIEVGAFEEQFKSLDYVVKASQRKPVMTTGQILDEFYKENRLENIRPKIRSAGSDLTGFKRIFGDYKRTRLPDQEFLESLRVQRSIDKSLSGKSTENFIKTMNEENTLKLMIRSKDLLDYGLRKTALNNRIIESERLLTKGLKERAERFRVEESSFGLTKGKSPDKFSISIYKERLIERTNLRESAIKSRMDESKKILDNALKSKSGIEKVRRSIDLYGNKRAEVINRLGGLRDIRISRYKDLLGLRNAKNVRTTLRILNENKKFIRARDLFIAKKYGEIPPGYKQVGNQLIKLERPDILKVNERLFKTKVIQQPRPDVLISNERLLGNKVKIVRPRVKYLYDLELEPDMFPKSKFYGKGTYERTPTSFDFPVRLTYDKTKVSSGNFRTSTMGKLSSNIDFALSSNLSDNALLGQSLSDKQVDKLSSGQRSSQGQGFAQNQPSAQMDKLIFKQPQGELQGQPQLERQRFNDRLKYEFKEPPQITELGRLRLKFGKKQKTGIKQSETYSVFLKRKGKFKPIATELTYGQAVKLGSERTLNTLSRSFSIRKTGKTKDIFGIEENIIPQKDIFREFKIIRGRQISTPGTFIQRRKSLLSTSGERLEIKQSRQKINLFQNI
jgi:hypothetical protein